VFKVAAIKRQTKKPLSAEAKSGQETLKPIVLQTTLTTQQSAHLLPMLLALVSLDLRAVAFTTIRHSTTSNVNGTT